MSVPNLAHLQSRVQFLLRGPADSHGVGDQASRRSARPFEYIELARARGVRADGARGIFPTVPVVTRLIRRHPRDAAAAAPLLTRLLPVPGWCFLNLLTFRKP